MHWVFGRIQVPLAWYMEQFSYLGSAREWPAAGVAILLWSPGRGEAGSAAHWPAADPLDSEGVCKTGGWALSKSRRDSNIYTGVSRSHQFLMWLGYVREILSFEQDSEVCHKNRLPDSSSPLAAVQIIAGACLDDRKTRQTHRSWKKFQRSAEVLRFERLAQTPIQLGSHRPVQLVTFACGVF